MGKSECDSFADGPSVVNKAETVSGELRIRSASDRKEGKSECGSFEGPSEEARLDQLGETVGANKDTGPGDGDGAGADER